MPSGITVKFNNDPLKPAISFHVEGGTGGVVVFKADSPEEFLQKLVQGYGNALLKITQFNRALKEKSGL